MPNHALPKAGLAPSARRAIKALLDGRAANYAEAAKIAGLREKRLEQLLAVPGATATIQAMSSKKFSTLLPMADKAIGELLTCDNATIRFEAAKYIRATQGLAPVKDPAVNVNIGSDGPTPAGYVINVTPATRPMKDVTPRQIPNVLDDDA